MPLPFNPMSFVTPYTAVGASQIGAGANFANVVNAARNTKVQEGYLANTQRRTAFDEEQVGKAEMDKARAQLDAAILSGNSDMADAALNNLRVIAERNGMTIAETRSEAALNTGVSDTLGEQKALTPGSAGKLRPDEVGSEEKPFDLDAYEEAQQAREQLKGFTGTFRPPGGSLPAEPGAPVEPGIRTPGGSLPPSVTAEAKQAPLRGYTLIGKDGKPLYTVAPKDVETNQRGRVGSVFSALSEKSSDAQEKQWLSQAQAMAEKAVGTMPIDEAVKMGLEFYVGRMKARDALGVVEANKRRPAGGGGGGLMGKQQDIAESIRYYSIPAANRAQKILNEDDQYADMEAGLASGDPALQRNAINVLYKIRAGTAVSAAEDARVGGIVSMLDKFENKFRQWTGGPISPEMLHAMQEIVRTKRRINRDRVQVIFDQAADEYEAQNEGKTKDPAVLKRRADTIRKGARAGGATSADDQADALLGD